MNLQIVGNTHESAPRAQGGLREQAGGASQGLVDEVLLGPGWLDDVV